jgi:predicted TIM-barrel fold metal-dependent hydrolase
VHAMTAGWAPKYIPDEVLRFAQRRNPRKLMWASDYPILPFDRTLTEATALTLTGEARSGFLGANALRVFGHPE